MSWSVVKQIVGVALVVLGGQGVVRLLVNNADGGLVAFVPGGFAIWFVLDIAMILLGAVLAVQAQKERRDP